MDTKLILELTDSELESAQGGRGGFGFGGEEGGCDNEGGWEHRWHHHYHHDWNGDFGGFGYPSSCDYSGFGYPSGFGYGFDEGYGC